MKNKEKYRKKGENSFELSKSLYVMKLRVIGKREIALKGVHSPFSGRIDLVTFIEQVELLNSEVPITLRNCQCKFIRLFVQCIYARTRACSRNVNKRIIEK